MSFSVRGPKFPENVPALPIIEEADIKDPDEVECKSESEPDLPEEAVGWSAESEESEDNEDETNEQRQKRKAAEAKAKSKAKERRLKEKAKALEAKQARKALRDASRMAHPVHVAASAPAPAPTGLSIRGHTSRSANQDYM